MPVKELKKEKSAVTVRYRMPALQMSFHYHAYLLSTEKFLRFKTRIAFDKEDLDMAVISPIGTSFSRPLIMQFILYAFTDDQIQQVEFVLDKPGRIKQLLSQAYAARNKMAHDYDLSVTLGVKGAVDDFADFSAEVEPVSGLKMYEFTEKAHTLLNEAVAGYSRLSLKEKKKPSPDTTFLTQIDANKSLALGLLRQSKTFSSLDELMEIVAEYTPIVKNLYDYAAAPPQPTS